MDDRLNKLIMNNNILTNEQIADNLLSDLSAYGDNIRDLIIGRLMDSANIKIYWDAWFRGATGVDLDNAEKGIVYIEQK